MDSDEIFEILGTCFCPRFMYFFKKSTQNEAYGKKALCRKRKFEFFYGVTKPIVFCDRGKVGLGELKNPTY